MSGKRDINTIKKLKKEIPIKEKEDKENARWDKVTEMARKQFVRW